ncbi:MAG: hypothetical protein QM736_23175 [Vicinamibacterales bacterium]
MRYRSLYWRIALGFVACLALLLVGQAMLFVWLMTQAGSAIPNQPPDRLAQAIAQDVAQALERDATLDIDRYVRQEYATDTQPFLVVLADGRTFEIGARFPASFKTEAQVRLDAFRGMDLSRLARGGFGRGGPFRFGERGGPQGMRPDGVMPFPLDPDRGAPEPGVPPGFNNGQAPPFDGRGPVPDDRGDRGTFGPRGGPPGVRTGRPWPIVVSGRLIGLVVVPPQPPFTFLLSRYAPTLITVAAITLVVGGAVAAFVISRSRPTPPQRCGGSGASPRRRRPVRACTHQWRRRGRGRGVGIQPDGRRSHSANRSARGCRPRASSAPRGRVA